MTSSFIFGPVTIKGAFADLSFLVPQAPARIDIKQLIYEKGASLSDIAREACVSPALVSRVARGETCSRRVANLISAFLGRSLEELWPGLYRVTERHRSRNDAIRRLEEIARNYPRAA